MKVCNFCNVKVLTMSMVNPDQILLRFQHLMDRTEDEEPIVISLQVNSRSLHCKKGSRISRPKPGCRYNQTLPGREYLNYYFWLLTSRLRTRKLQTFFYSVPWCVDYDINHFIFHHC
jgi:hypothetical protein